MYLAGFEIESFELLPVEKRCALVLALCNALTGINKAYLRAVGFGKTPSLYQSGVRYADQILGADKWKDIPRLIATGSGACEDLASWRVAELQIIGESGAFIDVDTYPVPDVGDGNGPKIVYHVIVIRGDGTREDPSALLGMKSVTQPGANQAVSGLPWYDYGTVGAHPAVPSHPSTTGEPGPAHCPAGCAPLLAIPQYAGPPPVVLGPSPYGDQQHQSPHHDYGHDPRFGQFAPPVYTMQHPPPLRVFVRPRVGVGANPHSRSALGSQQQQRRTSPSQQTQPSPAPRPPPIVNLPTPQPPIVGPTQGPPIVGPSDPPQGQHHPTPHHLLDPRYGSPNRPQYAPSVAVTDRSRVDPWNLPRHHVDPASTRSGLPYARDTGRAWGIEPHHPAGPSSPIWGTPHTPYQPLAPNPYEAFARGMQVHDRTRRAFVPPPSQPSHAAQFYDPNFPTFPNFR